MRLSRFGHKASVPEALNTSAAAGGPAVPVWKVAEKKLVAARSLIRPVAVVLGGLVLGWLVLAITADRVFADGAPRAALFWNPGSAQANIRLADRMLQENPAAAASPAIRAHALIAFDRQPVGPEAARLLGIAAATSGQEARADHLLAYAEAMSRRDVPTQLLLIESSAARGDVATALVHYDRAMRTSTASWPLLFPVLSQAADGPAIGAPLAALLERRPPWSRPFLEQFVPRSRSPETLFGIARRLRLDRDPSPDVAMLQLIEKRLVDLGSFRAAAALYGRAHGIQTTTGPLLRNGDFEQPSGWDPFDWNLVDEPDLSAQRQPSLAPRASTALFLSAMNGRGGDLAVQLVTLPAGRYRIGAQVGAVGGDRLAFPQLIVRCVTDGRELIHQPFPAAPPAGRVWQTELVVPANCPAQRLVLQKRSPLDPQQDVPWIDNMTITLQNGR